MNDILEGYYNKRKRENEALLFQAKTIRKAAFISVLPHTKNLTEKRFNIEVWPITDEEQDPDRDIEERVKRVQESVRKYNKQLSENRRKKAKK